MNIILEILLCAGFLLSTFLCPWWLTVFLGILILSLFGNAVVVILGGLVMDVLFGAPVRPLGGFLFLYTLLFMTLAALSWGLEVLLSE